MDTTIAGYLRGKLIVLLIVSGFYMVTLGLIGLNYGRLIGVVAGMFSFVPYLGSTGGFLVSGGVALSQYWPDYTMVGSCQRRFRLRPGYRRQRADALHHRQQGRPASSLAAVRFGGVRLCPGLLGLIISVPLAAAIGVLVRYAVRKYYKSALHNEGGDGQKAVSATAGRG